MLKLSAVISELHTRGYVGKSRQAGKRTSGCGARPGKARLSQSRSEQYQNATIELLFAWVC